MKTTKMSYKEGGRKVWVCDACRKEIKHAVFFTDKGREYVFCNRCYGDVTENGLPNRLKTKPTVSEQGGEK